MEPPGDEVQLEVIQDRWKVCIECIIGSEITWAHPMELLGDVSHVESQFFHFGDNVTIGAR
jgi:hypothetical protein